MKTKLSLCVVVCGLMLTLSNGARGQLLYSEDFETDSTSEWQLNIGTTDGNADFFFDYSTVGIPPAPGSESTRGMKLQANLFTGVFGGVSASPIGQSFTGSYVLSFYMWSNYSGGTFDAVPHGINNSVSGATTLSYGGVGSSGTFANQAGSADGVFFAFTPDGQSGSDYRAYSQERGASYQLPPLPPDNPDYCPNDCDLHANYLAGSRNNTASLYTTAINPLGDAAAPEAQIEIANNYSPPVDQSGMLQPGAMGFAWRYHEITVENDEFFTWTVDGTDLITIDGSNFNSPLGGSNIFFGTGDTNNGSPPANFNAFELAFTLVDNIEVNVLADTEPGDFDEDGDVDGYDFIAWQRGESPNGTPGVSVSAADLAEWQAAYNGGNLGAIGSVPEPGSLVLLLATAVSTLGRRGRKG